MSWQKIELSNDQIAFGELDKIWREFIAIILKFKTSPIGVYVFAAKDENDNMLLFFSPNASNAFSDLLLKYNSSQCHQPSKDAITASFFAGDEHGWESIA